MAMRFVNPWKNWLLLLLALLLLLQLLAVAPRAHRDNYVWNGDHQGGVLRRDAYTLAWIEAVVPEILRREHASGIRRAGTFRACPGCATGKAHRLPGMSLATCCYLGWATMRR